MVWEGGGEERDFLFLHFFDFGYIFYFCHFILFFVLGEGERDFFLNFVFNIFCFSDHFWPAPLLAHTTFGPDRLLATFFLIKPFCAQTFANHL